MKYVVNTPLRGHSKKTADPGSVIDIEDGDEAKSLVECGAISAVPADAAAEDKPVKTPGKK